MSTSTSILVLTTIISMVAIDHGRYYTWVFGLEKNWADEQELLHAQPNAANNKRSQLKQNKNNCFEKYTENPLEI